MNRRTLLLLVCLLAAGAGLRVAGLHFGLPVKTHTLATYHPDESIHLYSLEKLRPAELNFYPGDALYWGSFNFYLQGAVSKLLSSAGYVRLGNREYLVTHLAEVDKLYVIGRMISVVFGTGAVLVFFMIARRLYGTGGGLLGAAVMAVAPLAVTTSFYAKPDGVMFFWYLLSLWYALLAVETGSVRNYVLYGIFLGTATASKYSGIISFLFLLLLQGERYLQGKDDAPGALRKTAAAVLAASGAFVAINPYAVLRFHDFWRYFSGMMLSKTVMPSHIAAGYFDYLAGILPAAVGWPLFLAALSGMWLMWKGRKPAEAAMAVFAALYVLRLGPPRGQALTYCLPLIPMLLLFAVKSCISLSASRAGKTVVALALVYTAGYAASYKMQFVGQDTRETASDWIEKNIPVTATIAMSKNDFWTPAVLKEYNSRYKIICGDVPQSPLRNAVYGLERNALLADYAIVTSHEYGEYFRYRTDYPRESAVFASLMGGSYREIARFKRPRPALFGIPYYRDFVALDWMFPNPVIHILKRKDS